MSNRSLFEFNHDYWHVIKKNRADFEIALQRFLSSASQENADALERFGVRYFGTRHHSDGFTIEFGGRKTSEPKT